MPTHARRGSSGSRTRPICARPCCSGCWLPGEAIRPAPGQPPPPSKAPGLAPGADSDWTMLLEPARPGPMPRPNPAISGASSTRHYGAGIARHYGRDMTGMTMTAFPGHIGQFFSAVYAAVQHRPEPVFTEHEPPAIVLVRSWKRLILPFAEPGQPVSHFVVGNVPENAVGTLLDVMYDAALVTDGDGRIRLANRAAEESARPRRHTACWAAPVDAHLPGLTAVMQRLAEVDDVGAYGRHELTLGRGRRRIELEVSIGGTRLAGELLFVLVLRDLTERAQRERALQQIAFKDDLTGILNRRGLHQQADLRRPAGRRSRDGFGLLIVDIDGFKALNDSQGHAAGDRVLRTVASRLARSLRADDAVARWGGDEFVVLLHGIAHPDDLATAAAKLLDALRRPHRIDDQPLDVKVSIGGALQPVHGRDFDSRARRRRQGALPGEIGRRRSPRALHADALSRAAPDEPEPGAGTRRVRRQDGIEQGLGIGMAGRLEERGRRTRLDDRAVAQHRDPIRQMRHHGEVVADEEVGEPVPAAQVRHQVQDLRLDRDVERRDRLVGNDQLRPGDQRPGDGDPLPLAARELVRVAVQRVGAEPDLVERLAHPRHGLAAIEPEQCQRLGHDPRHAEPRVERAERVLEDHLGVAPELPPVAPGRPGAEIDGRPAAPGPHRRARARRRGGPRSTCPSRIRRPGPSTSPGMSCSETSTSAVRRGAGWNRRWRGSR